MYESIVSVLIINLSLLGLNIPFFFEVGAPFLALVLVVAYGIMRQKRLLQPSLLIIPCIISAFVDDIACFWLRTGGVVLALVVSYISFYRIDESCTADFKNECWKTIMSDISLISIIGMSIAQYFLASFWVFLVIYLVTLLYVYYLVVGFTTTWTSSRNLTSNMEQLKLFGINDDEI